jgi:NADPH-dependent curcumin reductase CurA
MPSPVPKIPLTQRALVSTGPGTLALEQVPVPRIAPDEVLVRTVAVALNPPDHKLQDQYTAAGAISGADMAGVVIRVRSSDEAQPHLKVGDRVCGFLLVQTPAIHIAVHSPNMLQRLLACVFACLTKWTSLLQLRCSWACSQLDSYSEVLDLE